MAVIWRRRFERAGEDPERVLHDARAALEDLRQVLADFRANLDQLEDEVHRLPEQEGGIANA